MPVSTMPKVIGYRVTGQKTSHVSGQSIGSASKQDMGMIVYQSPGINVGFGITGKGTHSVDKVFSIPIIIDNPTPLNPTDNNMVQRSR